MQSRLIISRKMQLRIYKFIFYFFSYSVVHNWDIFRCGSLFYKRLTNLIFCWIKCTIKATEPNATRVILFCWNLVRNRPGQTCGLEKTTVLIFLKPFVPLVNDWWWSYQMRWRHRHAEGVTAMMMRGGATWRTPWQLPLKPWWALMGMRTVPQHSACSTTSTRSGKSDTSAKINCFGSRIV